jgi:hypothetical protein
METMREAGARFQSLSEPWANTISHAGKLIMTVFAAIGQNESVTLRSAPISNARDRHRSD